MSFEVIVTSSFKKHVKGLAKKYPSLKTDLEKLIATSCNVSLARWICRFAILFSP